MIEFQQVHKTFDGRVVLDGVNFSVGDGELVVLLGPSGCGKTTTLKLVNRLLDPNSGQVRVGDRAVATQDPIALRRSIGYVFQRFGLFPHLSVRDNIAVVPKLLEWEPSRIAARVDELSALLGLADRQLLERFPASLSGGQQQRVGLARALAVSPRIMLMDEPFGALDPITRDGIQAEFAALHRRLRLTTLLVTHDINEALLLADRIVVMQAGRVEQLGTPAELLANPRPGLVEELLRTPQRQLERLTELRYGSGKQ